MTRALERRKSGTVTSGLGTGWRTVLTDLSLILFMVTASVLPEKPQANAAQAAQQALPRSPDERSEPVAIWRPGKGAPTLVQWLSNADASALLSLRVTYRSDHAGAVARAAALAAVAGDRTLRLLVEPGDTDTVEATLAYDTPAGFPTMARSLHSQR